MQEVIGTREATKRETRRALIEAALGEFAEKGFDAPSLDAICARAGYTRGAFYVHFSNRDELVTAAMEQAIGAFVDGVMATDATDGEIESTIARFAAFVRFDIDASSEREGASSGPSILTGEDGGPPFHKFLEACSRSETVRAGMSLAMERIIERLRKAVEFGQASGRLREDVGAHEAAGVLLLLALGVFSMNEIGLKLDVSAVQATVLRIVGRT